MKSEIEKLKEQVVQYSHMEREIGTMQIRVHELEEELQGKNEEFVLISEAIAEMTLWKEQKHK